MDEVCILVCEWHKYVVLKKTRHCGISDRRVGELSTSIREQAHLCDTWTRAGFCKLARCSLSTFVVIVAENKYVCRSFGSTLRILSITGPKSMSNSLSASSMTCIYTVSTSAKVNELEAEKTDQVFQVP